MKLHKLMGFMAAVLLLAGLAVAQPPKAKKHSYTGVVTDSMCGAKHMMSDAAACTRACVQKGASYALLVGDKLYTLQGDAAALDKVAGKKATVTGTVEGTTIHVASVKGS